MIFYSPKITSPSPLPLIISFPDIFTLRFSRFRYFYFRYFFRAAALLANSHTPPRQSPCGGGPAAETLSARPCDGGPAAEALPALPCGVRSAAEILPALPCVKGQRKQRKQREQRKEQRGTEGRKDREDRENRENRGDRGGEVAEGTEGRMERQRCVGGGRRSGGVCGPIMLGVEMQRVGFGGARPDINKCNKISPRSVKISEKCWYD